MPKRKTIVRKEGTPAGNWMVTFSDMNTLLLTFFVLLFSMSSIKAEGFQEFFRMLSGDRLGLLQVSDRSRMIAAVFDPLPEINKNVMRTALAEFAEGIQIEAGDTGVADAIELRFEDAPDGAVQVELADRILFEPGSVELLPDSRAILDRVRVFLGRILSFSNRRVVVEGHTDGTIPHREAFLLSARRAAEVLEYLLQHGVETGLPGLPPERFMTVGYGSLRPKVAEDTAEGRAKNRRVRIFLYPPDASIFTTERK
jgi:chemotaxis protein MotB